MRVLIVSNLYPPHYKGGYEIRCAQVAEALSSAGHGVAVLTSVYGLGTGFLGRPRRLREQMGGVPVHRTLYQHAYGPKPPGRPWTLFHGLRRMRDAQRFLQLVGDFEPDVVYWWSMNGLSKTLLPLPARLGIPDVHWIEHPWMIGEYGVDGELEEAFWNRLWKAEWGPEGSRRVLRRLLRRVEAMVRRRGLPTRRFPNEPTYACFVSHYLRDLYREAGIDFASSQVIYGGVDAERFYLPLTEERWSATDAPLRVLYASQITPNRGLHTVLKALAGLDSGHRVRLSVAGGGPPAYVEEQRQRVRDLGLEGVVEFLGRLPHDEMPALHAGHDLLVLPTTRPEGLPLTMVEAMLTGCAIVTTGAGGGREVAELADLPMFAEHDADGLRHHLVRLLEDRSELRRIGTRGQAVALEHFTFDAMMTEVEAMLERLIEQGRSATHGPRRHSSSVETSEAD
ncbi:MAG: glycosyltransferase family 4 protein [Gemmatimonadota bacterium]